MTTPQEAGSVRMRGGGRIWRTTIVSVGLTGGIGSGKSLALEVFESQGAVTVSADRVVHDAYSLPEVRAAVLGRFGNGILRPDGTIDRHALADRVFSRPSDLDFLESILHPIVRRRLIDTIAAAEDGRIVVAEVPLLFEAGWADLFDVTVALAAESGLRHRRTEHLYSDMDFAMRDALQMPDDRRREVADHFFNNDGTKTELVEWAIKLVGDIRREYLTGPADQEVRGQETRIRVVDVLDAAAAAARNGEAGGLGSARLFGEAFPGADATSGAAPQWESLPAGTSWPEAGFEKASAEWLLVVGGEGLLLAPDAESRRLKAGVLVSLPTGAEYRLDNPRDAGPLVLLRVAAR
jgi:dephospho-CoA kinase